MTAHSARTLAVVALLVGSVVGGGLVLAAVDSASPGSSDHAPAEQNQTDQRGATPVSFPATQLSADQATVTQFQNRTAFESYVAEGQRRVASGRLWRPTAALDTARPSLETPDRVEATAGDDGGAPTAPSPSRIAGTNVQVDSLDEPDIVKTDGSNFYYAPQRNHFAPVRPEPRRDVESADPREHERPTTHVIDATDPDAPEVAAQIDTSGKLLRTGDRLLVFENERIVGYDVSDPQRPTDVWSQPMNGTLVSAREHNGTVYLVTESSVGLGTACPIRPLGGDNAIACTDIYRPGTQIPVDATYAAFSIDADDGTVRDSVSFVGTARNSVVYMSPDALYVTYTQEADRAKVLGNYIQAFDRTPQSVTDRVSEIRSYDISTQSQLREMRVAVDRWLQSLPADERHQVERDFHEGLAAYLSEHKRNLTRTGIVRIDVSDTDLSVGSTGVVPGEPLNQFSLDEHNGTLRVATTIPRTGDGESENDLYTLGARSLERQGSVTGMGTDQRVYSVRYVDDMAYVVTFRQVDPLHVVDLSTPSNPVERGTLELPGYSSYLHPIDDDRVLGIGEEDGEVKAVLFDVSDPANPTIADSKRFDRHYSAVSRSHHAFLIDRKHDVFVLPAGQQSLVVDYTADSLELEMTVRTDIPATRTRYVEDSLYVFAGRSVTVVDETSWTETTTLNLDE
ncbi:MAG: beta-propeller domain-containing protein [Haloarculaceae archaeon]